jgi:hypothetical protein
VSITVTGGHIVAFILGLVVAAIFNAALNYRPVRDRPRLTK